MCELNPIELAWAQLKYYIRIHNTTGDFSIKILKELVENGIRSITPEDWQKNCRHVVDIENRFWETDQHMEEVEPLIITVNNDSIDDDDSESSDSDCKIDN